MKKFTHSFQNIPQTNPPDENKYSSLRVSFFNICSVKRDFCLRWMRPGNLFNASHLMGCCRTSTYQKIYYHFLFPSIVIALLAYLVPAFICWLNFVLLFPFLFEGGGGDHTHTYLVGKPADLPSPFPSRLPLHCSFLKIDL